MMKWYGWGDPQWKFPMDERPNLWPFISTKLNLDSKQKPEPPIGREKINLPEPIMNDEFCQALSQILHRDQMAFDEEQRLIHSFGKSYTDLVKVRRGEIRRPPDAVIFPKSTNDVRSVISLAQRHNVCVIPFGGGTNIVGGVNPSFSDARMVVSLDLKNMNRLLSIDTLSGAATIEAGALGPVLEEQLQKMGWSLGHYPDSFEYSTLGGWIATRSAGMQSDAYGKIEDMVLSLTLVTPEGLIETKTVPAASSGLNMNHIAIGSEGILGVITEATMKVHKVPEVKDYQGYLFKDFKDACNVAYVLARQNCLPSMIRIQDAGETELGRSLKVPPKGFSATIEKLVKSYLKGRGYTSPCVMVVGFEGHKKTVGRLKKQAMKVFRDYEGFPLGKGIGKTWAKDKFNVPYLRDVVMDHQVMVDVAETSTVWSNLLPLYEKSVDSLKSQFKQDGIEHYYIGCHLSHTYDNGACLYFTYAAKQKPGDEINKYYKYKAMITECFVKNGGTVSHHHAVGFEHQPWLEQEVSTTGIKVLKGVKKTLDPKNIMNPGKLIPAFNNKKPQDFLQEREKLEGETRLAESEPKEPPTLNL